MLDDLDQRRRVKPDQALVAVGQRALQETDPLSLRVVHLVELEPARGLLECADADIDAEDQLVVLADQTLKQRARAAPEIEHPPGP